MTADNKHQMPHPVLRLPQGHAVVIAGMAACESPDQEGPCSCITVQLAKHFMA